MRPIIVLAFPLALSACVDTPEHVERSPVSAAPTPAPLPVPPLAPPRIAALVWTWQGCGPSASALPMSLAVDVKVEASGPYKLYGQAVGCDPFTTSGALEPCPYAPDSIFRGLTVTVGDAIGTDTQTVELSDCEPGKAVFP